MQHYKLLFPLLLLSPGLSLPENMVRKNTLRKKPSESKLGNHVNMKNNGTLEEKIRKMDSMGLAAVKKNTERRIRQLQKKINNTVTQDVREKEFKNHLLELFIEELTESEKDMIDAQVALKKSLLTDFSNPSVLMENSKARLEALRVATLKEEQSYNRIKNIEIAMESYKAHHNHTKTLMDEFLGEIANAADQLESEIEEKIIPEDSLILDPARIEAVIHIKEGDEAVQSNSSKGTDKGLDYDERLDMLIDAQNNKFILSRPKDTTSPSIDHFLILDLILIYLCSFLCGYICDCCGILTIFGYVMAGVMLGPSGLNAIQSLVQVESFGEFGVYMIMFFAGLEFSIENVLKVWKTAVKASILISLIMVLSGMMIGASLNNNVPFGESAFIAICFSISSTPLVVRFLQDSTSRDVTDYTSVLISMLVFQDIQVGITVAILPAFVPSRESNFRSTIVSSTVMLFRALGCIAIVSIIVLIFARTLIGKYLVFVTKQTGEIQLLGALLFMFAFQLLTNFFGISMELGCFLSGFMISIFNHSELIENLLRPIHDLFVILFFATVGFHVFPTFVAEAKYYLACLTAVVIAGKYAISLIVLHAVLESQQKQMKWLISGGLAQVSEFAFVLASRARHLKIVSREVFLIILSITTLSLAFAPVMWKASIWKFKKTLHVI